jgi:Tol biopolymer transport system component
MITFERFEGDLPMLLEELAPPRTPDYLDTVFGRTAGARQRPAWTFPERWLPMSALTERMATVPRVRLRLVVLALLLLALTAAALYVGSQQSRQLPAPFGPAANGLIPYVSAGDIYVGDPVTGSTRLLVGGPENDGSPGFSPDGTKVAFLREVGDGGSTVDLYTVPEDGSGLTKVNAEPLDASDWINWTPDSGRFVIAHRVNEEGGCGTTPCHVTRLDLYDADGTGVVGTIATADAIDNVQFRPPDARELVYRARVGGKTALYAIDADGTDPRMLVEAKFDDEMGLDLSSVAFSADGSRIFYQVGGTAPNPDDGCCRLWVMDADGTNAHEFMPPAGRAWDGQASVSPDGTWVAYWHVPSVEQPHNRVSVARADGTGSVTAVGPSVTGIARWIWSPDSSKILMFDDALETGSAYLLDPAGGPWTTVPWQSDGDLDWQRVAPAP